MKVPANVYGRSPRVYRGLGELTYPFHDQTITVTGCGRICFQGQKANLSQVFAGQNVGVTQVGERIWLVTFMLYDWATSTMRRAGWSRSRIRSARKCYPCLRNELSPMCPE
jgi:putative transposase